MEEPQVSLLEQRIEDMDFRVEGWISARMNTRIRNALQRAGIHTVDDLVRCCAADLADHVQGCGIVATVIVEMKLKSMGLKLKRTKESQWRSLRP